MPLERDLARLSPGALVELFEIDLRPIDPAAPVIRVCNHPPRFGEPIRFQGQSYLSYPVEASGFEATSQGTLPRPKFRVSNMDGMLSDAIAQWQDLVGGVVTRRQTFERYLDGEDGEDALAELVPEVYVIERKVNENRMFLEWELVTRADAEGTLLPRRQFIAGTCRWAYKGEGCGWVPSAHPTLLFDANDEPVALLADDDCGRRFRSCNRRHGAAFGRVPFGGFPGVSRVLK